MDAHNRENFTLAYRCHWRAIVNHIYYRTSSHELAEELAQETFLKVWRFLDDNSVNILDWKNYLYKVAQHLVIEHYRQKHRQPLSLEQAGAKKMFDPSALRRNEFIIGLVLFQRRLERLNRNYREIMRYRFIEQLDIDQISAKTGKSANYVSVIIYRARKLMRQEQQDS